MANKRKPHFDTFDHSTSLHTRKEIVAMNNKFPGLTAYGILCVLMEMCGRNLNGKISFTPVDRQVIAGALTVNNALFERAVKYMQVVGIVSMNENFLSVDIIDKSIIRKRLRRESVRTAVAQKREKIKRKKGINPNVKESENKKRLRIWREFDEILILTDRIVNDAHSKYPLHGDIRVYFKRFITFVKTGYAKNYGIITHENYVANFYAYMNVYKLPLAEALDSEERYKKGMNEMTMSPIRFSIENNS